jgi:hypothetical protein
MKYLLVIVFLAFLGGCQSEIDKCVESGIKSEKTFGPYKTAEEEIRESHKMRLECLKAQSGK